MVAFPGLFGTSNNCANFISQALHFGGWMETNTWKFTNTPARCYGAPIPGAIPTCVGGRNFSPAWVNVKTFIDFATASGRAVLKTGMSGAQLGDVITADWKGGTNPTHLLGITGFSGQQNLVSQHTHDRRDFRLYNLDPRQESTQRAEPATAFRLLHIR
jgi:hypothetical protein